MNPYRPQEHAATLADWKLLLLHQAREIAALHGKVDRLLQAMPQDRDPKADAVFENLVSAIFEAMADRVWIVADLRQRANESDEAALTLAAALTAIGGDLSNKRLGNFITNRVNGQFRSIDAGLEIHRREPCRGKLAWSVVQVSD